MAAPMKSTKFITNLIYLSGFLDLFGVSMIFPLITGHAKHLGASPTLSGVLGSLYGAIQLFTSPLFGQWSDSAGRRIILLVCLLMSAVGYTMFSVATTITLMFLARVPLGIFKHSQNLTKSYLVDISTDSDQSKNIGNFNAASSIGFIIGPVVGGHIAQRETGFYLVALLAGALFLINFVLIWLLIPSEGKDHKIIKTFSSVSLKKMASDELDFNSKSFMQAVVDIDWRDLWDLYVIKFLLGASVIIFRSNFSLMLMQKFDTTPVVIGYIISLNGIVSTLVGFSTGHFSSYYTSNATLVLHLAIMLVFTMIGLAMSFSLWIFVAFLFPLCFVSTITRVAATSLCIERGKKEEIGTLMGFQQSCMSVARMIAPLVAGLSQEVTSSGPCIMGVVFSSAAVLIMIARPQDPRHRQKKQN